MIGVYHNRDLDGFTSGAIIKLKYPDAKMVGYDYGQPFEQEVTGEPIIMADTIKLNAIRLLASLIS